MLNNARNPAPDASITTPPIAMPPSRKSKLGAILVTGDDELWPQVGKHFVGELSGRQLDSIDELIVEVPPGQAGVLLWDARAIPHATAALSRIQMHSARLAVIVLDAADAAPAWASALKGRQIVAFVEVPLATDKLTSAIAAATDEARVRVSLLGDSTGGASLGTAPPQRRGALIVAALAAGLVIAGAVFFVLRRHEDPRLDSRPAVAGTVPSASAHAPEVAEQVDTLIEKAQQAMLDRHFIDPSDGSALSLYREALRRNPSGGEARQGIARVAEILFARVKSALDERKLDVALQSLETARSIDPADARLTELDARIAGLRAEVGPAQIQASINAQSFDRAIQLIDEASRAKLLSQAKLNQLRDEVRQRRLEAEATRVADLVNLRLQQDRLIEPARDSAAFYLAQARAAGPSPVLQGLAQEFLKRATPAARSAVDQHRFGDADRLISELRLNGAAAAVVAGLQHDLTASRASPPKDTAEPRQYADLVRARLAAGSVTEPDNDNALFYLTALRTADPQNSGLTQLTVGVQSRLLERARTALDAGQLDKAESMAQLAGSLGASPEVSAVTDRLLQAKLAAANKDAGPPLVMESALTRLNHLYPIYPARAVSLNLEGWVDVSYLVAIDGRVSQTSVLETSRPGVFEAAATQAIAKLRYKPYLLQGRAVAVNTKLRVTFRVE